MTDEEFVFRQTERERKRDGRGTFNKKRQGGRNVRLPSDGMSKKEWKKMNGEVKTYDMGKLVSWKEFRAMPHDIQQAYLDGICDRFEGIFGAVIAKGMGTTQTAFNQFKYNAKLSIKNNRAGSGAGTQEFYASEAGRRWLAWVDGTPFKADEPMDEELVAEEPKAETKVEPTVETKKEIAMKQVDMSNIALILNALVGTGAKLTIEISL